ncbi:MAG: hypothetical protein KAH38_06445 [Candidatus Hydrogenedentes bacterium]|nr:hypothetical protein [Candidatus Hydrogenedentota bacterium]
MTGLSWKPAVIAHRGASSVAPENTMAAFEKAVELGADWLELDCRLTRDGKLAVIHDPDIARISAKNTCIAEMYMSDMRLLDAGSWFSRDFIGECIPTLEEVLTLAGSRIGVYVEIKSVLDEVPLISNMLEVVEDGQSLSGNDWEILMAAANRLSADSVVTARVVIDIIRAYSSRCRIVAQSFSPVVATVFRHEAPELRFEFLGADLPEPPNIWQHYIEYGRRINVSGFNINKESMTEKRVKEFHEMGKTCAVWVVNEQEDIEACVRCDADAIITNKPDFCHEVLDSMGAKENFC